MIVLWHVNMAAAWIECNKEQPFWSNICGQIVGIVKFAEMWRFTLAMTECAREEFAED
jgi:hypothetical protein